MRKRKQGRTLSRNKAQRQALKRTMLVSLIEFGNIKTTLAKAKELKPFAERMITRAKKVKNETQLSVVLRRLKTELPVKSAKKLVKLAENYATRQGGYTRIIKLSTRQSDSAEMAVIEFVDIKKDDNGDAKREKKKDTKQESKKVMSSKKIATKKSLKNKQ